MSHHDFAPKFRALYDNAVLRYADGRRGVEAFFSTDELAWLAAHGLAAQNLYDYAEDHIGYGEPGPDHALAIELVRRDYFLTVQLARPSATRLDPATLPAKTETVRGLAWLPRLLPKAKAKLRGELPSALMFCCGGDRIFFRAHDLLPAEFLAVVWRHEHDDAAIVDWVFRRSPVAK
ncbi:MAG: hypothetical protein RLZZ15_3057 [Verrucomicrobiota bacterium]|jgi:hypothetical protein